MLYKEYAKEHWAIQYWNEYSAASSLREVRETLELRV